MDAGIFGIISIIGFSLAGVSLIAAIYLFFRHNIPTVIGDLSGRTAQKQIEAIRQQNAQSGNKRFRPSTLNQGRGKITEKVTRTNGLKSDDKTGGSPLRNEGALRVLPDANATEVISAPQDSRVGDSVTELLPDQYSQQDNKTEALSTKTDELIPHTGVLFNETEVLQTKVSVPEGSLATSRLEGSVPIHGGRQGEPESRHNQPLQFRIIEKILVIHTNEAIE